ncbi:queuosine precursor transporter [Legionella gresilensis]|uniref:queuosine precursor transporter n=1 Tax=Legionella gresilensis TaxID=91823 RepID=UPI001040F898|nr:queuosine precursor transporter [Legionella gresilensis]
MLSREPKQINLKYIIPLSLLYLTIYLAADAVAYKMVTLGPLLVAGPPCIFPLSYAIADIIAEVYGYTQAKKILLLTLFFQFLYAILVTVVLNLSSPEFWTLQDAYNQVFGNLLRFVSAGFFAVLSSHFINIYIFSKWKILLKGKYFWIRSVGSSAIGGLVLVGVIMIFGYSGTVDFNAAIKMFFSIYLLELVYACILAWPAGLISGFLKIKEGLDVYDIHTNFNPFSFK